MHFISPNSPLGRWLSFLLDALFICVAWAICSLPVITIGAEENGGSNTGLIIGVISALVIIAVLTVIIITKKKKA